MKWYWILGIIILSALLGYLLYWWSARGKNGNGKNDLDENGKPKVVQVVEAPSGPAAENGGGPATEAAGGGPAAAVLAVS